MIKTYILEPSRIPEFTDISTFSKSYFIFEFLIYASRAILEFSSLGIIEFANIQIHKLSQVSRFFHLYLNSYNKF